MTGCSGDRISTTCGIHGEAQEEIAKAFVDCSLGALKVSRVAKPIWHFSTSRMGRSHQVPNDDRKEYSVHREDALYFSSGLNKSQHVPPSEIAKDDAHVCGREHVLVGCYPCGN